MNKFLTIAALTSISLVSCQQNEITDLIPADSGYVSFDAYAGKTSRAVLTDNTTFNVFTVYGYQGAASIDWSNPTGLMDDVTVNKGGVTWSTEIPVKWPSVGTKTQFFAYSPKVAAAYSIVNEKPQLEFTAVTDVTAQLDLLVSASAVTDAPALNVPQSVALDFKHALSKVSTKVRAVTGLTLYVETVELCNLGSEATYTFDPAAAGVWGPTTTLESYGIAIDAAATAGIVGAALHTSITATDGAALVIPQATTAWEAGDGNFTTATSSFIKINYKLQNNADNSYLVGDAADYVTAYFPVGFNFEANKAYNLNITFGNTGGSSGGGGFDEDGNPIINPDALISFDVTLTDWDTDTDIDAEL